jgi:hypothetical protein
MRLAGRFEVPLVDDPVQSRRRFGGGAPFGMAIDRLRAGERDERTLRLISPNRAI